MEIEMKYGIGDKEIAKSIWEDEYLLSMEEKDSRERVYMKASILTLITISFLRMTLHSVFVWRAPVSLHL